MSHASGVLKSRYGVDETLGDPPWNATLETLLTHRSIRAYLPQPLPEGALELLVAAAQSAASSSNLQVWSVVAVEQPARKDRLAALASNQAQIRQAPLFLVWIADLARLSQVLDDQGMGLDELDYLDYFLIAVVDAALAAQNAVVAAESLGLGTVYIGAIRNSIDAVAAEIGLPPRAFPLFGLCVGYADPAHSATIKPRLPQSAVLHRETYGLEGQDRAIGQYDRVIVDFYTQQRMPTAGNWSDHSARRVANWSADSAGRKRLRAALEHLGFPLL